MIGVVALAVAALVAITCMTLVIGAARDARRAAARPVQHASAVSDYLGLPAWDRPLFASDLPANQRFMMPIIRQAIGQDDARMWCRYDARRCKWAACPNCTKKPRTR